MVSQIEKRPADSFLSLEKRKEKKEEAHKIDNFATTDSKQRNEYLRFASEDYR